MASAYLHSIAVPEQLPPVLEKLMKAVLRDQPKDIIRYCADYFSALESHELRSSRLIDPSLRQKVEASFKKCFPDKPVHVHKENVIKFIRFYANEAEVSSEPIPNSVEDVLLLLRGRTQLEKEELIDMVTDFFTEKA